MWVVLKTIIAVLMITIVFWSVKGCRSVSDLGVFPSGIEFTTGNNMPVLSWHPVDCEKYEIRIDGIKVDELDSRFTSYTPFPLSYGSHHWEVVAKEGDVVIESRYGEFTIEDEPLGSLPKNSVLLRSNWFVRSSILTDKSGKELSLHPIDYDDWYNTSIPATALTVLVRNGIYPNPYIAMNNMLIPDISDTFNVKNDLLKYSHIKGKNPWVEPYWYIREFRIPASFDNKLVWLNFNEINYKAEIWLNGIKLSDTSGTKGMERAFRFNITGFINRDDINRLAVAIYPPDHPGEPSPPPVTALAHPGRNLGYDAMLTKDYTKWDAMGWDWQPAVRDRDMGITEDVFISATDHIKITDYYITSDLPLPDTSEADIRIEVDLENYSTVDKEGKVTASISFDNESVLLERDFTIKANSITSVVFDKENCPGLHFDSPRLWWPSGYGKQNLYDLKLQAISMNGDIDVVSTHFGIREVETYIGSNERIYKVNGKQIYCKGGNWVIDMTLNGTASRYRNEINLTKNANMNMLRVWGPTGAPPSVFYDEADKQGILIWQDFLNDFWGAFKNTPGYYPNYELFKQSTISIVKKYRNHPSLIIWCGGNEGPNPREDLIMNEILPRYDGYDSKHYLRTSNGDGLHGGGPYHTLYPADYFSHPKLIGFSSELGPSGVPVYRSISKFISNPGKDWKPGRFPINNQFTYHDATDRTGWDPRRFSYYDDVVKNSYGMPDTSNPEVGIKQYFERCQLLNYDVYRAVGESINRNLWNKSSGWLLWKSNSSWPSLTWQVYDWYMQAHAGYYGCKKSAETFHIQLNRDDMNIVVLNTRHKEIKDVSVSAVMLDTELNRVWSVEKTIKVRANGISETGLIVPSIDELHFLQLTAASSGGNYESENFYWFNNTKDFTKLNSMNFSQVDASMKVIRQDEKTLYEIVLNNNEDNLAFMVCLSLLSDKDGHELLPTVWSDNYLNLLPGESKTVTAEINNEDFRDTIVLECKGYNTGSIFVKQKELL